MNRTNFLAQKAMRKSGNTANRTEQLLIDEIIHYHSKNHVTTELEKKITYARDDDSQREAIPDIIVSETLPDFSIKKHVIRVMGEYHDSKRQTRKDEIQKDYLLQQFDTVTDLSYYDMPYTFKRRDTLLRKDELIRSHAEVKLQLVRTLELVEPLSFWLRDSQHLKRQ